MQMKAFGHAESKQMAWAYKALQLQGKVWDLEGEPRMWTKQPLKALPAED